MALSERAPCFASTALAFWTNEGASGAPAQPGSVSVAKGQRGALAPSCSPNHGKASHLEQMCARCALRARKRRWRADA